MIAADSSTIIAYLGGDEGPDVDLLDDELATGGVLISPVVLVEILSDPSLPNTHRSLMQSLPLLEMTGGFWLRVAELRAKLIARRLRARLPDSLIAQACIDHDIGLLTRDGDFRHFAKHCGLKLA